MANPSPSTAKNARGKNGKADAAIKAEAASQTVGAAGRPSAGQIAQRAYEIYEREGRQPGREMENWLRAEAELTGSSLSH
jgi:hypothetical protein